MSTQPATAFYAQHLLQTAAEWRLISLLFGCPRTGWQRELESLAAEISDTELKAAVTAAAIEASEGLYHAIFAPGGPAAAREISYSDWVQPGYLLAELESYYRAFSYQPATLEVGDHIAVEVGFVSYLRLKQAYAQSCKDAEQMSVSGEAAQNFINDHLKTMVEPLAKSLACSGVDYLAKAAAALLRRVGPAKKRVQITPTALPGLEESSFECGEVET